MHHHFTILRFILLATQIDDFGLRPSVIYIDEASKRRRKLVSFSFQRRNARPSKLLLEKERKKGFCSHLHNPKQQPSIDYLGLFSLFPFSSTVADERDFRCPPLDALRALIIRF